MSQRGAVSSGLRSEGACDRATREDDASKRPGGEGAKQWNGVIAEYRDLLPVTADTPVITLGEGGTPLVPAATLSAMTGCEVYQIGRAHV